MARCMGPRMLMSISWSAFERSKSLMCSSCWGFWFAFYMDLLRLRGCGNLQTWNRRETFKSLR
jgi:hypothetical protein